MAAREIQAGRAVVEVSLRDRIGKGLAAIERRMANFGRSVATFGAAMSAAGVAAIGWPIKLAADMEQTAVAFEVMVGDATKAKKLLEDIQKFAAVTPFGFTDLAEAGRTLMGYGIAADDVMGTLKLLGDVSGGSAEKLGRLTLAYGQVQAKGRLMSTEVLQMVEVGFNPLQEISRTTGKSVAQLTKQMENGELSAAMLTRAFITATASGGRFNGMMDKQSRTLWGLFSTLVDNVTIAARSVGDALVPILKPVTEFAIGAAQAVAAFVQRNQALAKWVGLAALAVAAIGGALTAVGIAGIAVSLIAGGLLAVWSALGGVLSAVLSPMGLVVAGLIAAGMVAWQFRDAIGGALGSVAGTLAPVTEALAAVWDVFRSTLGGIVSALMGGNLEQAAGIAWLGFVAAAWTGAAEFGGVLQTALDWLAAWVPGVGAVRDSVVAIFRGIGQSILAGRWDLAGQILMARLQVAVAAGWARLSNFWAGAMAGFGAIWDIAVYGIRSAWNTASTALASGMLWVVGKLNQGVTLIVNLFDSITTAAQQAVVAVAGLISGTGTKAEAINKRLTDELMARGRGRIAADNAWNQGTQAAIAQQGAATQAGIDRSFQTSMVGRSQAEQATRAANASRVQSLQQRVAELEREAAAAAGGLTVSDRAHEASDALNRALEQAAAERKKAAEQGMNIAAPRLAAANQGLAKVESRGTFSAAAAATFAARSDAPEQTARNTGVAAKLLRVIADKPGPQFS